MSLTDRLAGGASAGNGAGPVVDQFAEVRERVHRSVIDTLGTGLLANQADEAVIAQQLHALVEKALADDETPLSRADRDMLARQITDEVVGYGPISRFLKDETVTEIMVNNHREIYIERGGRIFPTDVQFATEAHLRRILDKIVAQVGRRVDESTPACRTARA
jgi:pilus assembly protein CpaF